MYVWCMWFWTSIHIFAALRPVDRKKNRKRNLISANVGILMLGFMLVNGTIQLNLHILPLNLGRQFRFKYCYIDCLFHPGLRQLITSIIYDLAYCIITPSVVFYNAPVVRRQYPSWKYHRVLHMIFHRCFSWGNERIHWFHEDKILVDYRHWVRLALQIVCKRHLI